MTKKPKRTAIDWEKVLTQWCKDKTKEPELTLYGFAKRIGRAYNSVSKHCSEDLVKAYQEQERAIAAKTLKRKDALGILELAKQTNERPIDGNKDNGNTVGNQNARKHGFFSKYIREDLVDDAIKMMDGDTDKIDEVVIRTRVLENMEDNYELGSDGQILKDKLTRGEELTEQEVELGIALAKNKNQNNNHFIGLYSLINNTRLMRVKERQTESDIKAKDAATEKTKLETHGQGRINELLAGMGDD